MLKMSLAVLLICIKMVATVARVQGQAMTMNVVSGVVSA